MMIRSDFTICAIAIALIHVGADWTDCPDKCKCVWSDGKKTAECESANFTQIPGTFSRELQVLNLNRNRLRRLPEKVFFNSGVYNLHKIYLRECGIELINKNALAGLKVLIEIDLSYNNIHSLHRDLFRDCNRIREIRMTNNPIQVLDDGLFYNLTYLQIVDFSYCKLHQIGLHTFTNMPSLSRLELKGNNFSHLSLQSVLNLTSLKTLGLEHNPWNCDCHLRPLRNWVTERNLYSIPTNCQEPPHLEGKQWSEIGDEDSFACRPKILSVSREAINVLSCQAEGDPIPSIVWTHNSVLITNQSFDYVVHESAFDKKRVSNLTLRGSRGRDNREYACVARNSAGRVEGHVQVNYDDFADGNVYYGTKDNSYDVWILLAGCLIGASLLILLVVFVKCYICKRNNSVIAAKKDAKENTNGSVGQMIGSEEKSLINVINPVQKPPRRQEASLSNSEAELHESSISQYNGNESVIGSVAPNGQDRSIGSTTMIPRGLVMTDSADLSTDHCPPDLLSFPKKTSDDTSIDSAPYLAASDRTPLTRNPRLLSGSQYLGQFGTLPYSRSHSPFSPALAVVSRQTGYVTIPRKPRAPSWSASLSPVLIDSDEKIKSEPVYDNLGPRTTADGSSALNLSKCDSAIPSSYKNRPLPQTPTDPKRFCDPINELDSYSPILKSSRTPNAVYRSSPQTEKAKKDFPGMEQKRQSWARMTPDGTQVHSADETESLISPRVISPGITPMKKIPPNPPPKPKKKAVRNAFYEDEGEDGTEV